MDESRIPPRTSINRPLGTSMPASLLRLLGSGISTPTCVIDAAVGNGPAFQNLHRKRQTLSRFERHLRWRGVIRSAGTERDLLFEYACATPRPGDWRNLRSP